jgi:endonuclease/exonuclease/phosphatase family metal-dependent hydrolase
MDFVAGDGELAIWIRPGEAQPRTDRPAIWWQIARFANLAIHSVHLDAYASPSRVQQLSTLSAELPVDASNIVLGDFNLAPQPSDGRFGDNVSAFTSTSERRAFATLLQHHNLLDATAGPNAAFTFSRTVRGLTSSFRCDLALIPTSLPPSIVTVSSETRTGETAFTDHSGLLVELNLNHYDGDRADGAS